METLIHADVFFFIASIATIIFTILLSIALFYLIGILKGVKQATDTLHSKVEVASENLEAMRRKIMESFIFNLIFMKKGTKKNKVEKKIVHKKSK